MLTMDISDLSKQPKELHVGLKTVNNIFTKWQLNEEEQLAFLTDTATLVRISRILNIYRLLGTMWDPQRAAHWLRSPNAYFDGKSSLDVISDSEVGLQQVQQYLKYQFQDLEE